MKARSYIKIKDAPKIEAGSVLVAKPFGNTDIFERVVIMILEHNSNGTTGILLNRQSNIMISDALSFLKINKPLYYGGPSDTKIISYVHSNKSLPDSISLRNGLFWGGSFDVLSELIDVQNIDLSELNFFAGFVHWKSGQLDEEINSNRWWICEMNSVDLFTVNAEELWSECLEGCGHLYSIFANIPDPSIN